MESRQVETMQKKEERTRRAPMMYRAYICDMDGTLYYQKPLRMRMLLRLLGFYLFHPWNGKELLALRDYRRLRERSELSEQEYLEQGLLKILSRRYNMEEVRVAACIRRWMFEIPLKEIPRYADRRLIDRMEKLRQSGKQVFVYSDYPAEEKTAALGMRVDGCYSPDGKMIRYLKPNPQGLREILREHDLSPDEVLVIGDRYEKDVLCAKAAGLESLLLKRSRREREKQYREMEW